MQRYLINKYSHQHKIDVPVDNERNMLIKLWDQRRSMQIKEISEEVRDKVSMYGIMNSIWKQKELMIKIET